MQELVDILQSEQHQLDLLHYRLTVLSLVLEDGDLRHIRRAAADTAVARQRLREIDLLRATTVLLHLPPGMEPDGVPTARELAAQASHPWAGILRDLHETLASQVSEVEVAGFNAVERARRAIHDLARFDAGTGFTVAAAPAAGSGEAPATVTITTHTVEPQAQASTWRRPPFDDVAQPDDHDLAPLTTERALQDALQVAGRLRVPSLLAFLR